MIKEDKITVFIGRLQKIGVEVKLSGNYPWIYIERINGKSVTETFQANHGFTVAFTPIKQGQEIQFTDITEIFKLIRKYKR
jgi:phage tail protein X